MSVRNSFAQNPSCHAICRAAPTEGVRQSEKPPSPHCGLAVPIKRLWRLEYLPSGYIFCRFSNSTGDSIPLLTCLRLGWRTSRCSRTCLASFIACPVDLATYTLPLIVGKPRITLSPQPPFDHEVSAVWSVGVDAHWYPSEFRNNPAALWFRCRGRGVSNGHDRDGERSGFSVFSLRATKRQASTQTGPPRTR